MAEERKAKECLARIIYFISVTFLAVSLGALHAYHVSSMFENDRHFSHLSTLEREMSLRTEMGFYYSYYKQLVETRPFMAGLVRMSKDRLVEYPTEVNAFNRFNILPEVIVAATYTYLEPILNTTRHKQCYSIERGDDMTPVVSCVGLGEPVYFYLASLWVLSAVTVAVLFLYGMCLSGTLLGGVLAGVQYFMNHGECTRVMWTPNERENFAYPFLLLQMMAVTMLLKRPASPIASVFIKVIIFTMNCTCLLFWQFSQFVFLTQLAILFVMEQLSIIDTKTLSVMLHSHYCGIHLAILLMHGNDMLKTSLYTALFIVLSFYCVFCSTYRVAVNDLFDLAISTLLILVKLALLVSTSFCIKFLISDMLDMNEDSHIFDIFFAKFSQSHRNFHTMLYTCSDVFDFLGFGYLRQVSKTGLVPCVAVVVVCLAYRWLYGGLKPSKSEINSGIGLEKNAESVNSAKADTKSSVKVDNGGLRNVKKNKKKVKNSKVTLKSSKNSEVEEHTDSLDKIHSSDNSSVSDNNISDVKDKVSGCNGEIAHKQNPQDSSKTEKILDNSEKFLEKSEKLLGKSKTFLESSANVPNCDKLVKVTHPLVLYLKSIDVEAYVVYNLAQTAAFAVMAILVMRLKLLLTPHLCLMAAMVVSRDLYPRRLRQKWKIVSAVAVLLFTVVTYHGYQNILTERSHIGEYSNPALEELLQWVSERTARGASFAGPMPIMAAVMLSTGRPIVNHPHYENAALRQRTYNVYKAFSRHSAADLYREMTRLRVTYLVLEAKYCFSRAKHCSFEEIWDVEEPELKHRPRLCLELFHSNSVNNFFKVFENSEYVVLWVHDYSLSYTPKTYSG